jgi:hypothetical protein
MRPTVDAIRKQFIKTVYLDAPGLLIIHSPVLGWGAFLVSLNNKNSFQRNLHAEKYRKILFKGNSITTHL